MNAEEIARALGAASRSGEGWSCRCPAHDDTRPSLTVRDMGGKVVWCCHAGCEQTAVAAALRAKGLLNGAREQRSPFHHSALGTPSATWTYRHADGRVAFVVARYETLRGKQFRPWRPKGAGFEAKAIPAPRPLYGLPALLADKAKPVLVVEGEKCADIAATILTRYAITTWPGGAKAVCHADWNSLAGRTVTIWPDADTPRRKAAAELLARLKPIAAKITMIDPGDRPEAWDIGNAITEGYDPAMFLEEHAEVAPREEKKANPLEFSPEIITLGELLAAETKEPDYIIAGLLPPGVMMLGGRPKVGKSRLAVMIAEAVSQQKALFGRTCRRGVVVYLDLENAKWRISKRWRDAGFSTISPDRLRFILKWRRGNRAALLAMMDEIPELRLVVIDVWVKFRAAPDPRQQLYDQDYAEIAWLQEAAIQRGIAVLLVHHLTKSFDPQNPFASITGSVAVFGSVDNAMLLLKNEDGFRLAMTGRDIEDTTFALKSRGLLFECLGEIDPAAAGVTADQKRYLRTIETEPMTATAIAKVLDLGKPAVSEMLGRLEARALVRFQSGFGWTLSPAGRGALL